MRIAFTGTASTGKSTLIKELYTYKEFQNFELQFITADGRAVLESMGFKLMDSMTRDQKIIFQKLYFEKKKELEFDKDNFIVDRSFTDVASYWLIREFNNNFSLAGTLIDNCYELASGYDLHFYFPFGIIPFEDDGYRSRDEMIREQIGIQIKKFLDDWNIKYITVDMFDIHERVSLVISELQKLIQKK